MQGKLSWAILGTGQIARRFAAGLAGSKTGKLLAVASRREETAGAFADEFHVPRRYGTYEAALADPEVQAVYISTPHPMHARWAIEAARAGKHLLVEKPIGINASEAMAMIDAAREHDVFLMEAFMYRCHPQTLKVAELVRSRAIGDVQLINAAFSYRSGAGPESRVFAQALGGGGILDVGCYPVSMSRLVAGQATGRAFAEPLALKALGRLGPTGVDDYAVAALEFEGGLFAQCSTGVRLNQHDDNTVKIFGTEGTLFIPSPWVPNFLPPKPARIVLKRHDEDEPREFLFDQCDDIYTYEADTVARHIADRQAPEMSWDDTLGNMRVLDRWRQEIGLVYDLEKPRNV